MCERPVVARRDRDGDSDLEYRQARDEGQEIPGPDATQQVALAFQVEAVEIEARVERLVQWGGSSLASSVKLARHVEGGQDDETGADAHQRRWELPFVETEDEDHKRGGCVLPEIALGDAPFELLHF